MIWVLMKRIIKIGSALLALGCGGSGPPDDSRSSPVVLVGRVLRPSGEGAALEVHLVRDQKSIAAVRSSADGEFRIEGVEAGPVEIIAHDRERWVARRPLTLEPHGENNAGDLRLGSIFAQPDLVEIRGLDFTERLTSGRGNLFMLGNSFYRGFRGGGRGAALTIDPSGEILEQAADLTDRGQLLSTWFAEEFMVIAPDHAQSRILDAADGRELLRFSPAMSRSLFYLIPQTEHSVSLGDAMWLLEQEKLGTAPAVDLVHRPLFTRAHTMVRRGPPLIGARHGDIYFECAASDALIYRPKLEEDVDARHALAIVEADSLESRVWHRFAGLLDMVRCHFEGDRLRGVHVITFLPTGGKTYTALDRGGSTIFQTSDFYTSMLSSNEERMVLTHENGVSVFDPRDRQLERYSYAELLNEEDQDRCRVEGCVFDSPAKRVIVFGTLTDSPEHPLRTVVAVRIRPGEPPQRVVLRDHCGVFELEPIDPATFMFPRQDTNGCHRVVGTFEEETSTWRQVTYFSSAWTWTGVSEDRRWIHYLAFDPVTGKQELFRTSIRGGAR